MAIDNLFYYITLDENHNGTLAGIFSFENDRIDIKADYEGALESLLPAHETPEQLMRIINSVNRNGYAVIVPEEIGKELVKHDAALAEAISHPLKQEIKPDWHHFYNETSKTESPALDHQEHHHLGHFVTEIPVKIKNSTEYKKLHSTLTPDGQAKLQALNGGKIIYHPQKGYVLNAKFEDRGDNQPLKRSEEGPVTLIHYSKKSGLKQVDPKFIGSGVGSKQELNTGVPRTYFYRETAEPESLVTQGAKSKYKLKLDTAVHKLYDLANDTEGHIDSALKENNGAWNTDMILDKIKNAGYHGFYNSKSAMPDVISLFHPHPVESEEKL